MIQRCKEGRKEGHKGRRTEVGIEMKEEWMIRGNRKRQIVNAMMKTRKEGRQEKSKNTRQERPKGRKKRHKYSRKIEGNKEAKTRDEIRSGQKDRE